MQKIKSKTSIYKKTPTCVETPNLGVSTGGNNNFYRSILCAGIGLILGITIHTVSAWVEPDQMPPGGNIAAPLNTGSTGQIKTGGLILNTGGATLGLIVDRGLVGIGTNNPQATLDVNGMIRGTGLNITGGANIAGGTNFTGNVCINGDCKNAWPVVNSGIQGKTSFSRDGVTECCGNDATITLGENTAGTGKRAGISFHNAGVAEGTLDLASDGARRIRLYDNQGQGMGLEATGAIKTNSGITMGAGQTFYSPGRMHIFGEENLYLLNRGGVYVSGAWGGNGNITADGNVSAGNNICLRGDCRTSWPTPPTWWEWNTYQVNGLDGASWYCSGYTYSETRGAYNLKTIAPNGKQATIGTSDPTTLNRWIVYYDNCPPPDYSFHA